MPAILKEFKEFINKGNLLSIAIGFVMGAAFTAMVNSLVTNVIMPIAAIPFGQPNFDNVLIVTINGAQIKFGAFLTSLVSFLLIAWTVFLMVKAYNRISPPKEEAPAGPDEAALLAQVVDELKGVRADLSSR